MGKRQDKAALAMRPDPLPEVEAELRTRPPRPMVWVARPWSRGTIRFPDLLREGVAVRAWIVESRWSKDSEGPDVRARFAFESESRLVHGKFSAGFDALHLGVAFAEYASWLRATFRAGGTLTVLHPPGAPEGHQIFGTMELYVPRTLADVVAELRAPLAHTERGALLEEARTFLGPTIGIVFFSTPDRKEHGRRLRAALESAAGRPMGERERPIDFLPEVVAGLGELPADSPVVAELARICRVFIPGRWAAT